MSTSLLQLIGLSKAFGGNRVTDNLSLDIRAHELHAIIGPNGAGKTTLIHQISGLLLSDSGRILYRGTDVSKLSMDARARAGLVRSFQIVSVLPGFTVRENVATAVQSKAGSSFRFFRRVASDAALNNHAMQMLDLVGLAPRAQVLAAALSHGEKRQLELAITLAAKPTLMLLDEPLAGIGREEAGALIELLRRIKETTTIVLVEHDMDAVFALADRISVLGYGKLIASGTPREIRNNQAVRAAYLGDHNAP